jgi:uncharacterized membrane protein
MLERILPLIDRLLAHTNLPDLHPAFVHFPIALLFTALLFDLACLVARRQVWLDRAAAALYVLGTLGAGLSYLTGLLAERTLGELGAAAEIAVHEHQDLALWTLSAFAGVTLLRVVVSRLGRHDRQISFGFFRLLALLAAIAAQGLLFLTADYGGALVFRHEIGIGTVQQRTLDRENLEP